VAPSLMFHRTKRLKFHCWQMPCCDLDRKLAVARLKGMESRFTDDEKGLLEQAFQLRESQTEEQRAMMRAEFEVNWPALVAYVKQSEARGETMRGDVLFALGEGQDGPSIEKIVWYMLDRAVLMSTKSGP
jgi:hypothetical protein